MEKLNKLREELQQMLTNTGSNSSSNRPLIQFTPFELLEKLNEIADDIEELKLIEPCDLLNMFFNSKSDANKYLTASEQEDLENDFSEYWKSKSYSL